MRAALITFAVLAVGVAVALWLSQLGGSVEVRVGEAFLALPFAVGILVLLAGFLALHGLIGLLGWLRGVPGRVSAQRLMRRRAEGDAAVTRALVALAAGTPETARSEVRRARAALGDTPQTLLLAAEAERLAGREAAALDAFKALAAREDARFLGLRGLLRAAMGRGDWAEAQRLAREAEAAQPGAAWVREERAQLAVRTRDFREALALAPPTGPRAALALAAAGQEADEAKAAELERQAFAADPGFVPGALAHIRRLRAGGSARRARGVVEQAWAATPHPELGAAWLQDTPDVLDRIKAVEDLTHRTSGHPESRLLMAHAAIDAGLLGRARQELEALVGSGKADRRAYLLLAELEEIEQGDSPGGRAAQARWLREAATARPEPRWACTNCGTGQPAWMPVCPRCQGLGTLRWGA